MRRILAVAVALGVLLGLVGVGPTGAAPDLHAAASSAETLSLVRVPVTSQEQSAYLVSRFDESHNHGAGEIEIVAWPGDLARLGALGFTYEVVVADLLSLEAERRSRPTSLLALPGPDREDYRTLADYNQEMAALAEEHPGLVRLFELERPSLEGRTIYGVEIAHKVNAQDGRPIFYIDAIHHAREWPAAEYTMIWVHDIVEKFGSDPRVTALLKQARVIAVPIVNPDGFDYSRSSPQAINRDVDTATSATGAVNGFEAYWRKNRRSVTGVTAPAVQRNPDAHGVDPNRNYAYLWGDSQGGSSSDRFSQTYRGEAPFSEPETQNVRDIILGRPVTMVVTNHTYQGTVLRTGGGQSPEDPLIARISNEVAAELGYQSQPTVGYPTTGTTDDWAYAAMGAIGFTIEHGVIGFHPHYDEEVARYWEEHNEAFTLVLEKAADPTLHSVITGTIENGKATLTLTKEFETELSAGNPTGEPAFPETIEMQMTTGRNGTFEWHVSPSTRPYVGCVLSSRGKTSCKDREAYTLTIEWKGKTTTMQVKVGRGEVLDLGTIRL